jgi:hypothetical protein
MHNFVKRIQICRKVAIIDRILKRIFPFSTEAETVWGGGGGGGGGGGLTPLSTIFQLYRDGQFYG